MNKNDLFVSLVFFCCTKMRIYAKKLSNMEIKRDFHLKRLIDSRHNGMIKVDEHERVKDELSGIVRDMKEERQQTRNRGFHM